MFREEGEEGRKRGTDRWPKGMQEREREMKRERVYGEKESVEK